MGLFIKGCPTIKGEGCNMVDTAAENPLLQQKLPVPAFASVTSQQGVQNQANVVMSQAGAKQETEAANIASAELGRVDAILQRKRQDLQTAQADRVSAEADAATAQRELTQAKDNLSSASEQLAAAQTKAEQVQREVEEAARRAEQAQREAEEAARRAEQARREAEEASRRAAQASYIAPRQELPMLPYTVTTDDLAKIAALQTKGNAPQPAPPVTTTSGGDRGRARGGYGGGR